MQQKEPFVMMTRGAIVELRGDAALLATWALLNAWASWNAGSRSFAGHDVALEPGQCVTSTRGLATAAGVTQKVARRCLDELARRGFIDLEAVDRGHTVVTVLSVAAQRGHTDGHTKGHSVRHAAGALKPARGAALAAAAPACGHTEGHSDGHSSGHKIEDVTKSETEEVETEHTNACAREGAVDDHVRDQAMATWLHGEIQRNAGCAVPIDVDEWTAAVAALRRDTGLGHRAIGLTAQWAFDHEFWGGRITSAESLRRCFVTIAAQRRRDMARAARGYGVHVGGRG